MNRAPILSPPDRAPARLVTGTAASRSGSGARVWRVGLVLLVAASAWLPAVAQTDDDGLGEVRAELARLESEAQRLAEEYLAAWEIGVVIEARIEEIESSIATYGVDLRLLRESIRDHAVELYMNGADSDIASLFFSASPRDLDTRSEYLLEMRQRDQAMFNGLEVVTRRLEAATEELRSDRVEQQQALARLEEVGARLNKQIEEAQASYAELRRRQEEERARQEAEERARAEEEAARAATSTTSTTQAPEAEATTTTASTTTTTETTTTTAETTTTSTQPATTAASTTSTTLRVTDTTLSTTTTIADQAPDENPDDGNRPRSGASICPVDGFNTFTDTWGAPRSGGWRHEGVDMLAARGTPVVAVEDGSVDRMRNGGAGGITVWLRGLSGDTYYYAHLDGWAPGLSVGQEVSAGDRLGTVGSTGNAPSHVPHLHWEYHPGGGRAVNPTPLARELCG